MSTAADSVKIACPECGRQYRVARSSAGKRATCSCGLQFQVPASIAAAEPAGVGAAALAGPARPRPAMTRTCAKHPDAPATVACSECGALVCNVCASTELDGRRLCPGCLDEETGTYALAEPPPGYAVSVTTASASPFGTRGPCRRHPEVGSVANCRQCAAPICGTCDFQFPGGLHYCPACATSPARPLSPVHKGMVVWSMVLAGWATVLLVALLSGMLAGMAEDGLGAMVVGTLILVPGLAGLGLSCGGMERRMRTAPIVWVALGWNAILAAIWLLLSVIGSFM